MQYSPRHEEALARLREIAAGRSPHVLGSEAIQLAMATAEQIRDMAEQRARIVAKENDAGGH